MKSLRINKTVFFLIIVTIVLSISSIANTLHLLVYVIGFLVGFSSLEAAIPLYCLFYTKLFGLYSNEMFGSSNTISFSDASFMVAFGILTAWVLKKIVVKSRKSFFKNYSIILLIICMYTGVLIAYWRWGIPVINGTITFRNYIPLLLCFPISEALINNTIDVKRIFYFINLTGLFACLILIIQYFVFPNNIWLQIPKAASDRILFFPVRYTIHSTSQWFCFLCLYNYSSYKQNKSGKDLFYALVYLIVIAIVSQTRIFSYAVLLTLGLLEVLYRKGRGKQFRVTLVLGLVIGLGYVVISNFESGITGVLNTFFGSVESGTRLRSLEYFMTTIANDYPLLGGGITNTAFSNTPAAIGLTMNCFLSDLGIWGFYYQFGIQSCIALVIVYVGIMKKSKDCPTFIYDLVTLYFLIVLLQSVTVVPDYSLLILLYSVVIGLSQSQKLKE